MLVISMFMIINSNYLEYDIIGELLSIPNVIDKDGMFVYILEKRTKITRVLSIYYYFTHLFSYNKSLLSVYYTIFIFMVLPRWLSALIKRKSPRFGRSRSNFRTLVKQSFFFKDKFHLFTSFLN